MWDWIRQTVAKPPEHLLYTRLPANQTDADYGDDPINAQDSYFRLWLAEANLQNQRLLGKDFYPAVHADIALQYAGKTERFSYVAGVPKDKLTAGVRLNYPLTPLLPYKGGAVEFDVVLLAMQGELDIVKTSLDVLSNFTGLVTAPLGPAIEIARSISTGVNQLIGATDGNPELYLHQTLVGGGGVNTNLLRPGYYVAMDATPDEVTAADLRVREDRLYRASGGDINPVTGYDYFLLKVDTLHTRDDWEAFTGIEEARQAAFEGLFNPEFNAGKRQALKMQYGMAVMRHRADLTSSDQHMALQKFHAEMRDFAMVADGYTLENSPGQEAYDPDAARVKDVAGEGRTLKLRPMQQMMGSPQPAAPGTADDITLDDVLGLAL